jgi:arylsulfatase A-like enzyme
VTDRDRRQPTRRTATDRRTFLRGGILAGGALAAGGGAIAALASQGSSPSPPANPLVVLSPAQGVKGDATAFKPRRRQPNILVILVDQLRSPRWLPGAAYGSPLIPNISALARESVSFGRHFTAANDCTPARSALVTGLYTHQTGCLVTGGSTLAAGLPTWGSLLHEHGYHTYWYGKWHLTRGDSKWTESSGPSALARYGFLGGTYPSPDGAPGQGQLVDPAIAEQFRGFLGAQGGEEPWCTTVSFVNPHDIAFWYRFTDRVPAEASAPARVGTLPPNYETPAQIAAQGKPRLQLSLQDTSAASFGPVAFTGPQTVPDWLPFLDLYLQLQNDVDAHVGTVLRALAERPRIAENTIVLFTSDHGEYGASHGMRGKGAAVYEEAIRVPLMVRDPRGVLYRRRGPEREQLTSSVDVAPLLLTIGTGSSDWRRDSHYAYLAGRLDLSSILSDPSAPGRNYILHATDEIVTEFATEPYAAGAPLHVIGLRTVNGKYATYSNWTQEGIEILDTGQERELYDYGTHGGRLEIENDVGLNPLEESMHAMLESAVVQELRETLPRHLRDAQRDGLEDYQRVRARAASNAADAREAMTRAAAAEQRPGSRAERRRAKRLKRAAESGGALAQPYGEALSEAPRRQHRRPRRRRAK